MIKPNDTWKHKLLFTVTPIHIFKFNKLYIFLEKADTAVKKGVAYTRCFLQSHTAPNIIMDAILICCLKKDNHFLASMDYHVLIHFLGPFQVICPRFGPSELLDQIFAGSPEVDLFKWPVEPASRYAEVGLVRWDVVDAMMLARQDDMQVLQNTDVARKAKVGVRPLVDL